MCMHLYIIVHSECAGGADVGNIGLGSICPLLRRVPCAGCRGPYVPCLTLFLGGVHFHLSSLPFLCLPRHSLPEYGPGRLWSCCFTSYSQPLSCKEGIANAAVTIPVSPSVSRYLSVCYVSGWVAITPSAKRTRCWCGTFRGTHTT